MVDVYTHFVETKVDGVGPETPLLVNGGMDIGGYRPPFWDEELCGLLRPEDGSERARKVDILIVQLHAEISKDRWTKLGTIIHPGLKERLYDESVGLWLARQDALRSQGAPRPLIGRPTNMRGVRGFDARTASRIVSVQGDPSTGQITGVVVETRVGDGAARSMAAARLRRAWGGIFGRKRLP